MTIKQSTKLSNIDIQLTVKDNVVQTTSLQIADLFGKRHDNVVQGIESLECSGGFTHLNFQVSEYKDTSGKKNKFYNISKDGFVMLAMGFNGKRAMEFKEAYINAFNAMEQTLTKQTIATVQSRRIEHNNPQDVFPEHLRQEVYRLGELIDGINNMLLMTACKNANFVQVARITNFKAVKAQLKMAIRQVNLIIQDDLDRKGMRLLHLGE